MVNTNIVAYQFDYALLRDFYEKRALELPSQKEDSIKNYFAYAILCTCSTIFGFLQTRNAQQKSSSKYHIFRSLVELTKIMLSNHLQEKNATFSSLEHDAIIRDENIVLHQLFQEKGIDTTFHISPKTPIKDFLYQNLQLIYSNPQNNASPLKNFEEKDRLVAAWCSYLLFRERKLLPEVQSLHDKGSLQKNHDEFCKLVNIPNLEDFEQAIHRSKA